MHCLMAALLAAACLWPSLVTAVPAPGSRIIIDTDADVVINKVVSTVTTTAGAAGGCTVGSTSGAPVERIGLGDSSSSSHPWSPGATVLAPAVPPHVDTSQRANLMPHVSVQLFYVQPQASGNLGMTNNASVATVSVPQMNYPTINLMKTAYVSGLACSKSSATVTFNDQQAYQLAAVNWTQAMPFILITHHAECGAAYTSGEHGFLLVEKLSTSPNGLVIQLNVNHLDFQQAVGANNTVTVDIGSFSPNGNGTFNTSTSGDQTAPPGSVRNPGIDDSFDQHLDDSYGSSISLTDTRQWGQLLPNVSTDEFGNSTSLVDGFPVRTDRRRSLHKRGFFGDLGKRIKKVIPEPIKRGAEIAKKLAEEARRKFEEKARETARKLEELSSGEKSLDKDFFVNQYPSNVDSPWGRAYSIYGGDSIKELAYCVGCGVNGEVRVTGRVTYSIANGLKDGTIGAVGSLHSVLQLGLIADGLSANVPIADQTLASLSLGDLVLPGILNIGPTIKVGAGAALEVGATGKLLAGAILDWPNINAQLNVANPSGAKAEGFTPDITPVFSADGTVSATLDVYLKASLGFTIGLLNVDKFTKSIELIDQPGIRGTATVAGSAKLVNGKIEGEFTGPCAGVGLSANVYNKVSVDLAGFKQVSLADWSSPSLSRCVKIGRRDLSYATSPQPVQDIKSTWQKRQQNATNAASRMLDQHSAVHNEDASGAADNATFAGIQSLDGDFNLQWATNGNVYVVSDNQNTTVKPADSDQDGNLDSNLDTADSTTAFADSNGLIIGDSHGRVLHGYTNELATYNVSRLRLHIAEAMPKTSRVIALRKMREVDGGPDSEFIGAHDTSGNALFPIACAYRDKHSKLFLAEDPVLGVQTLQNTPDLTGHNVTACGAIRFHRSGGHGPA